MFDGPSVAFPFVQFQQAFLQSFLGRTLHAHIHCGVNSEPALIEQFTTVLLLQVSANVLCKIGSHVKRVFSTLAHRNLLFQGLFFLLGGDVAFFSHSFQDVFLSCLGSIKMGKEGIFARRLRHSCKHGGLCNIDFRSPFPEIGSCGRLHTIGAVAEIDLVQIKVEYSLFGESLFDLQGKGRLSNLSPVSFFRVLQKERLGHLLGDGAAPLFDFSGHHILDESPCNAWDVHPFVLVKPGIFSGNKGVDQMTRDLLQGNDDSLLVPETTDHLTITAVNFRDDWGIVFPE